QTVRRRDRASYAADDPWTPVFDAINDQVEEGVTWRTELDRLRCLVDSDLFLVRSVLVRNLAPKPSNISFVHSFDQAACESDLDVRILASHRDEPCRGEVAFQSLCRGQFPAHECQGPILHRPLVVQVDDTAKLPLADPP